MAPSPYEFNPACPCAICANDGSTVGVDDSGQGYCYEEPHMPPVKRVGEGTFIHSSAYIGPGVRIGRDCRIGPGVVIGWDGFGYSPDPAGGWMRKPESHGVVIGDRVDIGANACVDRGSYRDTVIGDGTKIDNGIHLAHNCQIGRNCLIIANAEVSGSVEIGEGAWIGPGACIKEHLAIGARAMVGIGAVVIRDVDPDTTVAGNPARVLNAEAGVREAS